MKAPTETACTNRGLLSGCRPAGTAVRGDRSVVRHLVRTGLLPTLLLAGCASGPAYLPATDQNLPMQLGRIQRLEQDGVTIEVSISTDADGSRFAEFGIIGATNPCNSRVPVAESICT